MKISLTLSIFILILKSAAASTYFVKPSGNNSSNGQSWDLAFQTVTKALSVAVAGDEIWVAAGTYKPTTTTDRDASFDIPSGVKLRGGFAGTELTLSARATLTPQSLNTILSGDINTGTINDNSYQIVTFKNASSATLLEGFMITRAYGPAYGGGIYNEGNNNGSSTPVITNCKIIENAATSGAGLYNNGANGGSGSAVLLNCIFENNHALIAGGAVYNDGTTLGVTSPSVTNCSFKNNSAPSGGGMYNNAYDGEASPKLTSCIFFLNSALNEGGAIFNYGYSSSGGSTRLGIPGARLAGLRGVSSPIITNTVFQGNSASTGGALFNDGSSGISSPFLTNCTFQGNNASGNGKAIYNFGVGGVAILVIANCIVWGTGNGVNPISNSGSSTTISYSIVEGSTSAASGNISAAGITASILFVNAPQGDLKLKGGSPALNTGNNVRFSAGQNPDLSGITTDLEGNLRIQTTVDMGAYELSGPLPVTLASIKANTVENRFVTIAWQTSSEKDFDRFEIERSDNPSNGFQHLGVVHSNESEQGSHYSYTDATVTNQPGNHYYRLKMIDLDGSYSYSRFVSAKIVAINVLSLYPNPANTQIHVNSGHAELKSTVSIHNMAGIQVLSSVMEGNAHSLSVAHLPAGMYSLSVNGKNHGRAGIFIKE